jgi:hypothetical protein
MAEGLSAAGFSPMRVNAHRAAEPRHARAQPSRDRTSLQAEAYR